MRIGIDFDNTIVSYDALFHKVARERDLIPHDTPVNKVAVRDHLRQIGKEELWTEMQGYVYGARMDEALAYPGVIDFLSSATAAGHELAIVSHKTKGAHCAGTGEKPAEPVPVASWLPLRTGLTPHGLRHGHQTWR